MSDEIDPGLGGLPSPRENLRLVGHHAVQRDIEAAVAASRMHHAILLSGPRGIGKATLGYALAAMLMSGERTLADALGTAARGQIAGGAAQGFRRLAVGTTREGKPKREIGVDEVRALQPFLRQRAGGDEWRVVLVDAADDLNVSSANALLKVLEEPGRRTLFVLLSHGTRSLLSTIRSRCIAHRMHGLSDNEMRSALEGSDLSASQIDAAIPFAGGSVRLALRLATTGATDLIDAARSVIEATVWSPSAAGRVMEAAMARGTDGMFTDLSRALVEMLREHAGVAGRSGRATEARGVAEAASAIEADLGIREAYGVDRALSLRAALQRAHAVVDGRLAKDGSSG